MVRFLRRHRSHERREKHENAEGSSSSCPDNSSTPKSATSQSSTASLHFFGPPKSRFIEGSSNDNRRNRPPSDIELLKQRFSKLLLGEDMSGAGIGVSSALAISNAITNLAASILGEQRRLEPMEEETKARWWREISGLLSVTDFIVDFVPSKQVSKDGTSMEVMITEQRKDLRRHIPALRKLDKLLIECLDAFKDQNEFWYASKDKKGNSVRREDEKWWIPTVEVPADGLSEGSRKWLRNQRKLVSEVLGEAMEINADVLANMDIPESYLESLPKKGKASLGESLYKIMKDDDFEVDEFLSSVDLSTEHKTLDLKNRIEALLVIVRLKMSQRSSAASMEKREKLEERAELTLLILKHRFPALPQSNLDVSKIQCNRDVGRAIVESYSRVIESRAFTVLSRIDDVLYADSLATAGAHGATLSGTEPEEGVEKTEEIEASRVVTPEDFKEDDTAALRVEMKVNREASGRWMKKLPNIVGRRTSYLEKIESCEEPRSPESRH